VANVVARPSGEVAFDAVGAGRVVLRRAAFPAWRVTALGREVPLEPGPLVAFDVTPGHYRVWRAPLDVERVGWAISAAAFCVFAIVALLSAAHRRAPRSGVGPLSGTRKAKAFG
jgi:hypothetical protein